MGKLIIASGDIIQNSKDVEAIVNPTNKFMDYGSGVCGAIYDSAGAEQLENYCHNKWTKEMEINEIRITTGFALAKDIIHIYVPRYYEEEQPIEKLKESYLKLFEIIKNENYKSVIIPSLGTGLHCYQHEDVARMVMKLLNDFCKNNDVKIIFDLIDENTKNVYMEFSKNENESVEEKEHIDFKNIQFMEDKELQNGLVFLKYRLIELEAVFSNVMSIAVKNALLKDLLGELSETRASNSILIDKLDDYIAH